MGPFPWESVSHNVGHMSARLFQLLEAETHIFEIKKKKKKLCAFGKDFKVAF